jgi:hypothetical protein
VFLVSDLPAGVARRGFTEPFATLSAAVEAAVRETKTDRIVVVPEGPYVVTRAKK